MNKNVQEFAHKDWLGQLLYVNCPYGPNYKPLHAATRSYMLEA